jgi:hypothetical protein
MRSSRRSPASSGSLGGTAVEQAATLEDVRAEVLAPNRLNAMVFGGFAGAWRSSPSSGWRASWPLCERTHAEFGVRLPLGSRRTIC